MFAMLYNFPSGPNGTLRDIQTITTQNSPIILQGGVYSTNPTYPTQPGTLLGSSAVVTTTGSGTYIFYIPGNVTLVSGQPYWLCLNNYWPNYGAQYSAGYQTSGNYGITPLLNIGGFNYALLPDSWPTYGNDAGGSQLPIWADFCK